jgi:hypothetical protein
MADTAYRLQGLQGGVVITTETFSGVAREVFFPVATEVASYAGNLANGAAKLAGVTFPAGSALRGLTTGLSLTSGLAVILLEESAYTAA